MNIGQLAVKGLFVILILFFLSLVGAITFPLLAILAGTTGAGGVANLVLFLLVMLFVAVIGYLVGKGIRSVKKPVEAVILTYAGAFLMGAILVVFAALNLPYTANVHLNWLGSNWYSAPLTIFIIGSPIMLTFLAGD
jgi:hypothetical protein